MNERPRITFAQGDPDEFLRRHRAYHQQQRARRLLIRIAFGFAFVAVVAMVVIAFR